MVSGWENETVSRHWKQRLSDSLACNQRLRKRTVCLHKHSHELTSVCVEQRVFLYGRYLPIGMNANSYETGRQWFSKTKQCSRHEMRKRELLGIRICAIVWTQILEALSHAVCGRQLNEYSEITRTPWRDKELQRRVHLYVTGTSVTIQLSDC